MITSIDHETSSSSSSEEDSDDEYREEESEEETGRNNGSDDEKNEQGKESSEGCSNEKTRRKGKTKENPHECPHCDKKFEFPNKLRLHMRVHEKNRYQCFECESSPKFDTRNQLRTHQKTFHSQASHKCPQCSYTSRKADIHRHFQQNHVDGVSCTVSGCFMKIAKNRLKSHLREYHATTSVDATPKPIRAKLSFSSCPKCDYSPDESLNEEEQHRDLMRHIEIIHEKKGRAICPFGCGAVITVAETNNHWSKCPKFQADEPSTSTPRLYDDGCRNTNTVTSQSTMSETSTGYPDDTETEVTSTGFLSTSLNEVDLENDEVVSEPPRKKSKTKSTNRGEFNCEACDKTFKLKDYLRKHVRSVHSQNPKRERKPVKKLYACDRTLLKDRDKLCEKTFRTEQALQDHFNFHDDIQPYACLTCNQRFYARDRFAVHLSKYHLTSIKDLNSNEAQFGARSSAEESIQPIEPNEPPTSKN